MSSLLTFIISFFAAFLGVFFYNGSLPSPVFQFLTSYNQHPISPHHASWNTWLHPSRAISEGSGVSRRRGWNIHHHLGGNGPWIEMIVDEEFRSRGIHPPPPRAVLLIRYIWYVRLCHWSLDMMPLTVLQIARHSERYPTTSAGDRRLNTFATSL